MNPRILSKQARIYLMIFFPGWLALLPTSFAQLGIEWEHTYGGTGYEELNYAALTPDGGYLFAGITTTEILSPGAEVSQSTLDTVLFPEFRGDFWVVKTDGNGQLLWNKRYGGFAQDRLFSIQTLPDGSIVMGGESRSGIGATRTYPAKGGLDYWLLKTDANGNVLWDRAYGGPGDDILRRVIPLPDGGFFLAGYSGSDAGPGSDKTQNSRGMDDFWVLRIKADGSILWQGTYGGLERDWLLDASLTHDGNFILTGWSESGIGGDKSEPLFGVNDYWVLKVDAGDGHLHWQKTLGGPAEDVCLDVFATNDGRYLLSGHSSSNSFGNKDAWLIELVDHPNFATVSWEARFGAAASDLGYSVAQNSEGYYMVAGQSSSDSTSQPTLGNKRAPLLGESDYWILFLSPDGEKIWDESLGGSESEKPEIILSAHDHGFIIAGISNSGISPPYKSEPCRGQNDFWVVRTGCSFPPPMLDEYTKICRHEEVLIDATIAIPCDDCNYIWADGVIGSSRTISPDTTTELKVTVVHPDGCAFSDSLLIEVAPVPERFGSQGEPVSCYGAGDATFSVDTVIGGAPPYLFSFDGADWEENADYTQLTAGVYSLEIRDVNDCVLDTTFYIAQPEEVLVELGPDIYAEIGDSFQLQALTNLVDSFTFEWGQPQMLSCADCLTPWIAPDFSTTVSIRLKDQHGCEATDVLQIIINREVNVYAPTVFSPNLDNINDFFTLYSDKKVKKIRNLVVFDRWGEKMFGRQNFPLNVEQLGWDGTLDGQPMKPAVFVWWAELEYADGRIEIWKGDVTLMR